ncbi:MAG TPA: selenoneine biosynthesis selenosugar synthase SenB [Burkholderiaceae bacterium]|nr:selenoneine biosynthesis selenosugar synthase SenB [Burkholderiaceae bacterium]
MKPAEPGSASIVLVTPALADANNGNWQTARRWARLLKPLHRVEIADHWAAGRGAAGSDAQLLIALHARRSAASIVAWKTAHPERPLIVALTGTDLYRDIDHDPAAQHALTLADRLIVLNELGARALPAALRGKVRVVLQSCSRRVPRAPAGQPGRKRLRVLMVGHLRAEKDPATYQRAALRLRHRADLFLDHIGRALQPELADAAQACMQQQPRYRWLGGLPHSATRDRMARAHLLVHASRMEGGAHAVIEAIRSGVPVLASAIDGNLGLLGTDYAGTFAAGDDAALARLIERFADEPAFAAQLRAQCAARADRFSPEAEAAALRAIVSELLG